MSKVVTAVDNRNGAPYPERTGNPKRNVEMLQDEEDSFARPLDKLIVKAQDVFREAATVAGNKFMVESASSEQGKTVDTFIIKQLDEKGKLAKGFGFYNTSGVDWRQLPGSQRPRISGEDAFRLCATEGAPFELLQIMA